MKRAFVLLFLVADLTAQAVVISSTSAGDGYFHDETGSSYDYFDAGSSGISAYYTYWGTSDTLQYNTGYIQFSLAAFTSEDTISSATLNLYLNERHYSSESPSAGFIKHASSASSANGSASQKIGGDVQVVEIKDQSVGWLSLDVTSLIQSDIGNGYSYACFSFNPNTAGYFRDAGFNINSADAVSGQPSLSVNVIPEPATFVLFGLGFAGAWLVRRNKIKSEEQERA